MNNIRLSIIIPAYNEEKYISHTLASLVNQFDSSGRLIHPELYQIVIVDNNSSDNTVLSINEFKKKYKNINCYVVKEEQKSVVAARIAGYNFVLNDKRLSTPILASGDADVIFHPLWVSSVIRGSEEGADVISNAGCFPLEFWMKVPALAQQYLKEIGTIFFDAETIAWLDASEKNYLFTESIFFDFIRLATDQCFAISRDSYVGVGGYTRDFLDENCNTEYFDEGGRLMAKVERTIAKIIYSNLAPYKASPRRILNEPLKFLQGFSYNNGNMEDYRFVKGDCYELLNAIAYEIDYSKIRKYIIKNYIILKCITRPHLIEKNYHYFGTVGENLLDNIQSWWNNNQIGSGRGVIELADRLTELYFDALIGEFPKQFVPKLRLVERPQTQ